MEAKVIDIKQLRCKMQNIDIDYYIEFRDSVKKHMPYPDWLGDFTKDDLEELHSQGAIIWIYYLEQIPVCSMMLIPSTKKSLNKFELNYDEREVVDYGPMFVHPKYRGNRLQYQMLNELDKYCLESGYKYAVTTVHPDNIYSIQNLIKDGFKLITKKQFTRGLRNVYLKNFD